MCSGYYDRSHRRVPSSGAMSFADGVAFVAHNLLNSRCSKRGEARIAYLSEKHVGLPLCISVEAFR